MRGIVFIAIGALLVVGYMMGLFSKLGLGGDTVDKGTDKATGLGAEFMAQPWAYTAIVAAVLATLGIMTWKRIGGWGRAAVLVCASIAVGAVWFR